MEISFFHVINVILRELITISIATNYVSVNTTLLVDSVVNVKQQRELNMKILSGLTGTINSLTSVVIALLGLGIVVSLLGGNVPFVGGVADNIVGLVQGLGDAGIVGLVAAIIILNLYK